MIKIFISGSTGSIGGDLKQAIQQKGFEVVESVDPKLRIEDPQYFEAIEDPDSINVLYHLAARTFVPASWESPSDFIKVNVLGMSNVLDFCVAHNINLVHMSSYIYGYAQYLPIDEKHPVSVPNPYALSKIMAEELCEFYGQNLGLRYNIIRPFNVFGSMKNKNLLIPEIIEQVKLGKAIHVKDLDPRRDYIYQEDMVDFLVQAMSSFENDIYNLGSGESYSVKEIIDIIQDVWGTTLPVESAEIARKNEISETICDISKIKAKFNWEPRYSFKQGVERMKEIIE